MAALLALAKLFLPTIAKVVSRTVGRNLRRNTKRDVKPPPLSLTYGGEAFMKLPIGRLRSTSLPRNLQLTTVIPTRYSRIETNYKHVEPPGPIPRYGTKIIPFQGKWEYPGYPVNLRPRKMFAQSPNPAVNWNWGGQLKPGTPPYVIAPIQNIIRRPLFSKGRPKKFYTKGKLFRGDKSYQPPIPPMRIRLRDSTGIESGNIGNILRFKSPPVAVMRRPGLTLNFRNSPKGFIPNKTGKTGVTATIKGINHFQLPILNAAKNKYINMDNSKLFKYPTYSSEGARQIISPFNRYRGTSRLSDRRLNLRKHMYASSHPNAIKHAFKGPTLNKTISQVVDQAVKYAYKNNPIARVTRNRTPSFQGKFPLKHNLKRVIQFPKIAWNPPDFDKFGNVKQLPPINPVSRAFYNANKSYRNITRPIRVATRPFRNTVRAGVNDLTQPARQFIAEKLPGATKLWGRLQVADKNLRKANSMYQFARTWAPAAIGAAGVGATIASNTNNSRAKWSGAQKYNKRKHY